MKNKLQNKEHFGHHHILLSLQPEEGKGFNCKACDQAISVDPFHGCLPCKFYLHNGCANAPRSLIHSSHPTHPLTLLPTTTYSTRSYFCNACDSKSDSYSFSCAHCEFDLHMQCASMPNTILLKQHPHKLKLVFGSPYKDKSIEYMCDVCSSLMNPQHWLYYCGECDFGAHLGCAGSKGCAGEYVWKQQDEGKSFGGGSIGKEKHVDEEEETLFEVQEKLRKQEIEQQLIRDQARKNALSNARVQLSDAAAIRSLEAAARFNDVGNYTTKYYYY